MRSDVLAVRRGLSRLSCCGNNPEDQERLIQHGGDAGSPGVASGVLSPSAVAVRAARALRDFRSLRASLRGAIQWSQLYGV
jgi:hypothetical protein